MNSLIEIKQITFSYSNSSKSNSFQNILKNISLNIYDNEILCIVGESGSGKTTFAKLICGLMKPTSGEIKYSEDVGKVQILFQNSDELLNPKRKVIDVLRDAKASEQFLKLTLSELQVSTDLLGKSCGVISGGERQRVALARVLLAQPKALILDEPFSAQDFESKENFKTFLEYKNKHNEITLIVITHDIALIKGFADRIAVFFEGKIVETSSLNDFVNFPKHPYSKFLLDSTRFSLTINTVEPINNYEESACAYYSRCVRRENICLKEVNKKKTPSGFVICNKPSE